MLRFTTASIASLALVLLAGCGAEDLTTGLPPGDAQLAILNAIPLGTLAELRLDNEPFTLPEVGNRISRVIPAGTHRLEAVTQGGHILASAHFSVGDGGRRTAILGGRAGSNAVTLAVAPDTAAAPRSDAIKVRVVNTVQGTPTLEAWLFRPSTPVDSHSKLVSPFDFGVGLSGEFPGYVVRSPGIYRVQITNLATEAVQAEVDVEMFGGQVWSVILTRRIDGELELLPIREL